MTYEETPISKKPSGAAIKKARKLTLDSYSTSAMLWHLVKRHKVALLAIGNIVLVLNWALPEWTSMVLGLIGR
jgi:hypothetical protein